MAGLSILAATQLATDALDRMGRSLDRLSFQGASQQRLTMPTGGTGSAADMDRVRAEWRQRLQDPAEIDALKRRLGLR